MTACCLWTYSIHNEGSKKAGQLNWFPYIDSDLCIGCRECVMACEPHALEQRDGKAALVYPERCTYCSACESLCPVQAIQLPYLIRKASEKELL
jgi:NAD-dependent dihydropyrimidine dehydrogenase PreA subunit